MEIVYTRKAKKDLQEIREYYETRTTSGLQNIIYDILSMIENIPSSISKGRITPHPEVWEKITPRYEYLIPYSILQGTLYILRVYDTRRKGFDYKTVLELEE